MSELPLIEISCPLCGSGQFVRVTQAIDYVYGVPGQFAFVRCGECRHMYINPRPSDEALMSCYPANYSPHTSNLGDGESRELGSSAPPRSGIRRLLGCIPLLKRSLIWLGQQHATLIPPLPDQEQPRLLEIGCAHGGYLAEASAAGWQVDGVEPNERAAQRARQRGFDVQSVTFTAAGLAPASRDAVVAWMVLEHVPDPVPFLREAFRVLTEGGTLCVSVPNAGGFERLMFGRHWLGYDAPRHLQVFTAKRLRRLLAETGFVDINIIHQSSIRYWWGSVAAWGLDHCPESQWPQRWMDYFVNEQPRWMKISSLVPEKALALLRLSGRITIAARKPTS